MTRFLTAAVLTLLASPAFAGLTYKFQSVTTGLQKVALSGDVAVEKGEMRLDIASGDGTIFRSGTFALVRGGAPVIAVVDPNAKSYYELRLDQLLGGADSALRQLGGNISVANPKVSVTDGGDGGTIEGYATRRKTIEGSYDMVIDAMGSTTTLRVTMKTESWITDRIGSEFANIFQLRGVRTGIESFDKLLDSQAGALDGFPLKQVSTVQVSQAAMQMSSTTTTTVTSIAQKAVPATHFTLPAGFTKTDNPIDRMLKQVR